MDKMREEFEKWYNRRFANGNPDPEAIQHGQEDMFEAYQAATKEAENELNRFRNCIPKKHPEQHICPDTISGRFAMLELELEQKAKEAEKYREALVYIAGTWNTNKDSLILRIQEVAEQALQK